MTYYVGDIPAEDLVIEPARNGSYFDLTPFDACDAALYAEDGTEVMTAGFTATITGDTITVEWPGDSPFDTAGMYSLRLILESATGGRERLAPIYFVAQADDGWLTLDAAREDWPDARAVEDRLLYILLEVSKRDVLAYAPALAANTRPPYDYVKAQGDHARNKLNATKVDPSSGGFEEGDNFRQPFPLDWTIKQTLRPKRGVPVVG